MSKNDFTRRKFIKTTGAVAAGTVLSPVASFPISKFNAKSVPTIAFGKTGVQVPLLLFGCGSRFMSLSEEKGLDLLEFALDKGLYYWDTAAIYKNDKEYSETRLGKILKTRRQEVFLASKVSERNLDDAKRSVETSLNRLQTDYIDLLQIHSIIDENDVKKIGGTNGLLSYLQKLKKEGVIKYIGFSGHTSDMAMKLAAEMYDFDSMLIALNHMRRQDQKFEELSMPVASKKGMAVLAMKVIRPRETVKNINPDDLFKYALSLPGVTAVNIGMESKEVMQKNIDLIKNFKPLSKEKMQELHVQLHPFYINKKLPWMQAGYYDGMHWA